MTPPRPAKAVTCACGKRGWPTKWDADQVNAKILRYLRANNRRREQRTYRCTVNRALWHVTSHDAAREYIEALLLADLHRCTDPAWLRLLCADYDP